MLGVPHLELHARIRVHAAAERDGLWSEIDAGRVGSEVLGQERDRSAAPAADVEHAPAAQVGGTDRARCASLTELGLKTPSGTSNTASSPLPRLM